MLLEISLAVVGVSFLLALIFLAFMYVKFYIEDRFDITGYKIFRSRLKRELMDISRLSGNEFPIVRDVCDHILVRVDNNFSDDSDAGNLQMDLSMKYGDDNK